MEEAAAEHSTTINSTKEKQTLLFFLIDSLVNWLKRYYNSISRQSGIVHKDKSEKLKVLNEWICEQWLIGGCRWPSAKPTIQSNLLFLMGRLVELGLLRPCGPRKQMKSIENWLVLFYWCWMDVGCLVDWFFGGLWAGWPAKGSAKRSQHQQTNNPSFNSTNKEK